MADKYTPVVSQFKLPGDETVYYIKDKEARELIEALGSPMHFLGISSTDPTSAGGPTIPGHTGDFESGDVVAYEQKEYVYNGSEWVEFGDLSDLGEMAMADTASAAYTPAGTITMGAYTPAGEISKPGINVSGGEGSGSFTGETLTSTGTYTPEGSISVGSGTANYTPAGSVSTPEFTGTAFTSTGSFTPAGAVTATFAGTTTNLSVGGQTVTASGTFTPAGDVTINLTPTVSTVTTTGSIAADTVVTEQGTLSTGDATIHQAYTSSGAAADYDKMTATYTAASEQIAFGYTTTAATMTQATIAADTTGDTTVLTTVTLGAATKGAVTVSGIEVGGVVTAVSGDASFSGTEATINVSGATDAKTVEYTPAGTVDATFTGTANMPIEVSGTATGSISQPTFTGTGVELAFGGTQATIEVEGVPEGDVTVDVSGITAELDATPVFTGTAASLSGTFAGTATTITVNPD